MGDVIQIGAVVVEPGLSRTFCTPVMLPMFDAYNQGAYDSIGMTREEHLLGEITVEEGFSRMRDWVSSLGDPKPVLVSDNPAFDWQWINFGFTRHTHHPLDDAMGNAEALLRIWDRP